MDKYLKILKPIIAIVAIAAAICLVVMINTTDAAYQKADSISENISYFRDFTLKGLDGETFTQSDLKDYKVTVINGWAPWCGPCTGEIPSLDKLNDEYKSKGLRVIGVVADYYPLHNDGEADGYNRQIRDVIAATGCKYRNFVSDEAFYNEPYVSMKNAFPCTWAVDSQGNVIEIVRGRKSEEDWCAFFDKWLDGR